ncbi:MAG: SDR family oxidoreductase [Gammaproteobacteria bacterium]|nr:SDR family oxidoreductase [Gammaproteobacteria bacterium]
MPDFVAKYGPWALVTGASSGMGAEFARQLAGRGLNVVLTARREDRLQDLSSALVSEQGIETRVVPVDLSEREGPAELGRAVDSLDVGLLINNAGFTTTGDLLDNDGDAETRLLDVNCRAPLVLAHSLGRKMKTRGRGGIIFLASTVAFAAVPQWANYSASKAYLLLLAESLAHEVKPHGIDVLALCPGFTRTEFGKLAPLSDAVAMDPDTVVKFALSKLGKATIAIPGFFNKFAVLSTRTVPRALNTFVYKQVIGPSQKLN